MSIDQKTCVKEQMDVSECLVILTVVIPIVSTSFCLRTWKLSILKEPLNSSLYALQCEMGVLVLESRGGRMTEN